MILLIDDDPLNLHAISQILKVNNIAHQCADESKKALQLLLDDPQKFNLVLIDRMMLGMDALDFLKHLKNHSVLQNIPVIIMTGEAEREDQIAAFKAGATDFIFKPIEPDLLLALVKKNI